MLFIKAACASTNSGSNQPHLFPADRVAFTSPAGLQSGGEFMISDFFRRMHITVLNLREENGQTMAEYGVVLAVITVGIVATPSFSSPGASTTRSTQSR